MKDPTVKKPAGPAPKKLAPPGPKKPTKPKQDDDGVM
jgi:hypothetical protein